jgi:hypothetical protein
MYGWMGANVIDYTFVTPQKLKKKKKKKKPLVGRCNCKQSNKKYSTIIMHYSISVKYIVRSTQCASSNRHVVHPIIKYDGIPGCKLLSHDCRFHAHTKDVEIS